MSENTREVPQLADATYARTLVIESTNGWETAGIHCVLKFFYLSGFLRHYLLKLHGCKRKELTTDMALYISNEAMAIY